MGGLTHYHNKEHKVLRQHRAKLSLSDIVAFLLPAFLSIGSIFLVICLGGAAIYLGVEIGLKLVIFLL